ncbi:hypothetical protein [Natronolimnohabitans innermongolicus]|uniref:Uncharacterized protein n=1 Tax=Natronolimnohabitans innermongolicus JCM 12255 TaxID=1227499 RepID=L9XAS5_9EURY|nr:hypothetical protein [Natronolimnohabitans innermongolicus]ELY57723.1 hypothetical protein C493_07524 [Natronolimnohabitans innermongolicus JCM 12255]
MSVDDDWLKVAARCRECGAVYSAWVRSDDSVQPIGRKDGCRCGATTFQPLSKRNDADAPAARNGSD